MFFTLGVPSAPQGPIRMSNKTSTSIDLSWKSPEFDGGTPITHYNVELRDTKHNIWRRIGLVEPHDPSFTLTDLEDHLEYFVRVSACNREGDSFPVISELISPPKRRGKII